MMKSVPGLPKLVQHLADYVEEFGIEVESDLTQSWKSTDHSWCQHYYSHVKETWTVYQRHAKRLNHFHTNCLRKLLKIKWRDMIPDTEVLKRAGMHSVHTLLKMAQLSWPGHVTRMPDERLPKKILCGELQVKKCSHGSQKQRYKDTLKASLYEFSIPTESWEKIAQDRAKWRGLIRRDAGEYEAKRISEAEQKRAQRKAKAKASPTELPSSDLSNCNRQFRALRLVSSAILEHTNNNTHLIRIYHCQ